MRNRDLGRECGGGQVALRADPAGDPVLQARELAMPATIALRLRRKAPGGRLQLDHVVDELDRDLEPFRSRPVRVPLRHMTHHTLTQLYRMRLAHPMTPISASSRENHIIRPKGILNLVEQDTL